MKWCEHLDDDVNYFVERKGECELLRVKPKFCFECGSKRPEEPKTEKMADVLNASWIKTRNITCEAQSAIEYVEKVAKEFFKKHAYWNLEQFIEYLKQRAL